jgi:hypothetical protein
MTTAAVLGANAVENLGISQTPITAASINSWPSKPGLYAVYGSPRVWRTLTLGDPPDARPLYVGKAERSLSSRDVGTHFGFDAGTGNSITGSSTLRRSLSALLRESLGLIGQYRNPSRPERAANFGLSPDQDALLSSWMRENLLATFWEMPSVAIPLRDVETVVLARLQPPLNIQHVQHEWKTLVKRSRAVMAADCRREL